MSPYVMDLRSLGEADAGMVGHKAANLAALFAAGFPVPAGFCLTTDAFHRAVAPLQEIISDALSGHTLANPHHAAEAARRIESVLGSHLSILDEVVEELHDAMEWLGDQPVSVRSSALAEDLEGSSFAGQYETVLDVTGFEELCAAVLLCWHSFYSAHAIAARGTVGIGGEGGMAVLVQEMVEAECAGVCFSVDPVQLRRDLVVISAAWGTGTGVVGGAVPSDTYRLERLSLRMMRRQVTEKREQLVASGGELHRIAVPAERRRAACLPDSWAQRVAEAAVLAERHFGMPQDMEWAIANDRLWVLQSRPLTGLPEHLREVDDFPVRWVGIEDRHRRWSLWWESRERVPPPLEHDYRDALVILARDDACRFLGEDHIEDSMIVNGRRYQSKRVGVLGSGDMRVRSQAIEQMNERMLQEHGLTGWDVWGPEIVARTRALHGFDRRGAADADLACHLEDALAAYRRHWMLHSPFIFPNPKTYFAAYAALTGKPEESVGEEAWVLAEGEPTLTSEMLDALYALGAEARAHRDVAEIVRNPGRDARDRLGSMPEATRFLSLLDAFLDRYGERNGVGRGSIRTPLTPTWGERVEAVFALAAPYLDPEVPAPAVARQQVRAARDAAVERLCAACPDEDLVAGFRRQLELARRLAQIEETHNHYIDQLGDGQLRLVTLEAARRLYTAGVIAEPDDIWWLHCEEILSVLRSAERPNWADLIDRRKADNVRWEEMRPPPVLGAPEANLPPRPPFTDDIEESANDDGVIRGQGGSRGRRSGPARLISMGTYAPQLQPGDVLVAVNAGPAWTAYFPILAGVVLDEGSFGEHSAGTAREYGIPVVFSTRDASMRIAEGEWITVDGTAGVVELTGSRPELSRD